VVNKAILIGRLGRDPEMRTTGSGTAVCNFTMATDEGYRDKASGEWQKRTEWHRIVAWARLAEQCSNLLSKGKLVYIEGRLQTREWNDRDGNKRTTTEVVANVMRILTPKGGGAGGEQAAMDMDAGVEPPEDTAFQPSDDDVPF
jgi:single-strand DNA-binding protein